ncbi:MAG: DUF488 domain-containing protein [candidate division WOR-3 bacterium]
MKRLVYTIGTSKRTITEFINLLQKYQIKTVIDVRRFPTSKIEHFQQKNLITHLARAGIQYRYLGKELGGYRTGGYEKYTSTPEYFQGITTLEKICAETTAAIMCAEIVPFRCHRRFITATLKQRKWQVIHIITKDKIIMDKNLSI